MSISVSVPLDALKNPRVAKALAELMMSLGGLEAPAKAQVRATAETAPVEAGRAAPKRRAPRKTPVKAAPIDDRSEPERYQSFIEGLPEPSRAFLDLIRVRREVTLSEAVKELNITVPKAIGGITGSLSRWARERSVNLPFEARKNASGERVWVWTRKGEPPPKPAGRRARGGEGKSRRRKRQPRASRAKAPEAATEVTVAEPTGPLPVGEALLTDPRFKDFVEDMSDTAREFLVMLSEEGQVTMSEALKSFGLTHAQAIGAVIRSFRKRARDRSLSLPFTETRSRTGERMWEWAAGEPSDDGSGEKGRGGSGVLRRKKGQDTVTPL